MQLNSLYFNDYISNYDLIYKNNIKNIHNIVKVKSLVVDFNLKNYLINNFGNSKESNIMINFKFFLLLYLLFSISSIINYKIFKNADLHYSLKIKIANKANISDFINKLYIYFISNLFNNNLIQIHKIKNLKPNNKKKKNNFYDYAYKNYLDNFKFIQTFNLKLEFPIISIHLLNFYPKFFFDRCALKNIFININFHINIPKNIYFYTNYIFNLPSFWIFKKKQ